MQLVQMSILCVLCVLGGIASSFADEFLFILSHSALILFNSTERSKKKCPV